MMTMYCRNMWLICERSILLCFGWTYSVKLTSWKNLCRLTEWEVHLGLYCVVFRVEPGQDIFVFQQPCLWLIGIHLKKASDIITFWDGSPGEICLLYRRIIPWSLLLQNTATRMVLCKARGVQLSHHRPYFPDDNGMSCCWATLGRGEGAEHDIRAFGRGTLHYIIQKI
jgi:hypothetical protein